MCQLLNFLWQLNSGYFQQGWWHITLATTITNWWHRARMSLLGLRAWSLAKKGNRLSLGWRGRIGTLWWCWGPLLGAGLWWGGSLRGCRPLCSSTGPLVLHWIRNRFWLLWNGLWSFCSFSTGSMDNLSRLFGDPSKDTLISRLTLPLHVLQDTMTWSVHNRFFQNDLHCTSLENLSDLAFISTSRLGKTFNLPCLSKNNVPLWTLHFVYCWTLIENWDSDWILQNNKHSP